MLKNLKDLFDNLAASLTAPAGALLPEEHTHTLQLSTAVLLVAWNIVVYMLIGYGFWGMASLLFDVRESRRVFSVIGAGDLPAKLLGYLTISMLANECGK